MSLVGHLISIAKIEFYFSYIKISVIHFARLVRFFRYCNLKIYQNKTDNIILNVIGSVVYEILNGDSMLDHGSPVA